MKDLNPFSGRKVKTIELVFENFESFKVDVSGVCDFNVFDIKYSISFFVKLENDGDVNAGAYCNLFFLSLNDKGGNTHGEIDNDCCLKDYLNDNYVSHVNLLFDDSSFLSISLPWVDGEDTSINSLQEVGCKDDYVYVKVSSLDD